jgi:hypothetical protein
VPLAGTVAFRLTQNTTMMMTRTFAGALLITLSVGSFIGSEAILGEKGFPEGLFDVTTFSVLELTLGTRAYDLAEALRTTGLIAVVAGDSTVFESTRKTALSGLCRCAKSDVTSEFQSVNGADSAFLLDGLTTRTTFATATVGDTPLSLPHEQLQIACGPKTVAAMESLRDVVATASRAFVSALDRIRHDSTADSSTLGHVLESIQGTKYHSVSSVIKAASHLEHFHVYSRGNDSDKLDQDTTQEVLHVHTDAGLFLSFVPGIACGHEDLVEREPFSVSVEGIMKRASFPVGSVGVMLGVGAEYWLKNMGSLDLRATRHAVQMAPGTSRAWYGMSKL